jgi:predicted enzyme related to lactoylglutathione lyase
MDELWRERVDANPPEGTPSWLELSVPDPDRARTFYAAMFGWTFEDDLCLLDGLPVAAIRPLSDEPGDPDGPEWTVYFAADDCDRVAERVGAAGGRVVRRPHEVGDRGRAAVVTDPVGARFGLWQGRAHAGTRLVNGYGTLLFNYLYTAEQERALSFYREVFGYRAARHFDGGDLVRADGHTVASIALPEDVEGLDEADPALLEGSVQRPGITAWLTYFAVENAEQAVDRLLDAGGQVHADRVTECAWGRLAAVKDPLGTPFRLIEPWDVI